MFTEPYRRLCVFPIVILYFLALPLKVFLRYPHRQLRRPAHNVLPSWNSNDALQFATEVEAPFANRLFELVEFVEHQLLFHHTSTNDVHLLVLDVVAGYMLSFDSGMYSEQGSIMKNKNENSEIETENKTQSMLCRTQTSLSEKLFQKNLRCDKLAIKILFLSRN